MEVIVPEKILCNRSDVKNLCAAAQTQVGIKLYMITVIDVPRFFPCIFLGGGATLLEAAAAVGKSVSFTVKFSVTFK